MSKHAYAIHELHFADSEKKTAVAAGSTVSLSTEQFNEFEKLNAVRVATDDEVAAAKTKGFPGVTETAVSTNSAAAASAAQTSEAEAAAQKLADAAASTSVAAQSDANREAAKNGQVQTKNLADVIKALDGKNDEHWTDAGLPAVDAVKAAFGSDVTRAQIEKAAPGFVRPSNDPLA